MVTQEKGETYFDTTIVIGAQDGKEPIRITSTTLVEYLNSDLLDGKHDGQLNAKYILSVEVDDSGKADNRILVYDAASGKLVYEDPSGGGLGDFMIMVYLGGDDLFVAKAGGGTLTFSGTVVSLQKAGGQSGGDTVNFYPETIRAAYSITKILYDRKKALGIDGIAKYRIYVDKIDKDGTPTNLWDSTLTTITETDYTAKEHEVSLSVAKTDVVRIRLYLYVEGGSLGETAYIRGLRAEASGS